MKKKIIRLLSMLLMVVMVAGAFGGCGKSSSSKSSNPSAGTKSSAAKASGTTGGTQTKTSTATGTTKTSTTSEGTGNTSSTGEGGGTEAGLEGGGGDGQTVAGTVGEDQKKSDIIITENRIDLGGMKLEIWAPWFSDPENGDVLVREGISTFYDALLSSIREAEKKYNCKITYLNPPGDERQTFLQSVMAGQVPCTTLEANIETAIPSWSDSGIIVPLDNIINFDSPVVASVPGHETLAVWKGVHWGYPAPVSAPGSVGYLIHYNRTIFDKFGIEDPQDIQDRGQWTWDTFVDICQKLTVDMNGDGIIDQYALASNVYDLARQCVYSNGGHIFKYVDGQFKLTMMEPASLRGLNFAIELANVYKVVMPKSGLGQFRKGQTAMVLNYLYQIKYHKDNGLTDEVGLVSFPIGPDSPPGNLSNVNDTTRAFFFPSSLDRKEDIIPVVCDAVTNWDLSKSYYVNGGNNGKRLTAWDGLRRPQDTLTPRDEAYAQKFADACDFEYMRCLPPNPFATEVTKAFNQETSMAAAIESIISPMQAIMDELNSR